MLFRSKLFTLPPAQMQAQYTRLANFKEMLKNHDPDGKFRNEFIESNLFSS